MREEKKKFEKGLYRPPGVTISIPRCYEPSVFFFTASALPNFHLKKKKCGRNKQTKIKLDPSPLLFFIFIFGAIRFCQSMVGRCFVGNETQLSTAAAAAAAAAAASGWTLSFIWDGWKWRRREEEKNRAKK